MPFALITIGVLIFVTALNGTSAAFGAQVYKDLFSEDSGFIYWVAGIVIVGFIGYIPSLKKPADLFMILIIVAMLMKNGGFFSSLQQGLANEANATTGTSATNTSTSLPSSGLFSGPLGGILLQQQASLGTEPLTTPAPVAGGTPLGQGGIGSA